jgi:hypothetical protein
MLGRSYFLLPLISDIFCTNSQILEGIMTANILESRITSLSVNMCLYYCNYRGYICNRCFLYTFISNRSRCWCQFVRALFPTKLGLQHNESVNRIFFYYFDICTVHFFTVYYLDQKMHNICCAFVGLDNKLLPGYCMHAIKYPTLQFNSIITLDKLHKPAQCLNVKTPTN